MRALSLIFSLAAASAIGAGDDHEKVKGGDALRPEAAVKTQNEECFAGLSPETMALRADFRELVQGLEGAGEIDLQPFLEKPELKKIAANGLNKNLQKFIASIKADQSLTEEQRRTLVATAAAKTEAQIQKIATALFQTYQIKLARLDRKSEAARHYETLRDYGAKLIETENGPRLSLEKFKFHPDARQALEFFFSASKKEIATLYENGESVPVFLGDEVVLPKTYAVLLQKDSGGDDVFKPVYNPAKPYVRSVQKASVFERDRLELLKTLRADFDKHLTSRNETTTTWYAITDGLRNTGNWLGNYRDDSETTKQANRDSNKTAQDIYLLASNFGAPKEFTMMLRQNLKIASDEGTARANEAATYATIALSAAMAAPLTYPVLLAAGAEAAVATTVSFAVGLGISGVGMSIQALNDAYSNRGTFFCAMSKQLLERGPTEFLTNLALTGVLQGLSAVAKLYLTATSTVAEQTAVQGAKLAGTVGTQTGTVVAKEASKEIAQQTAAQVPKHVVENVLEESVRKLPEALEKAEQTRRVFNAGKIVLGLKGGYDINRNAYEAYRGFRKADAVEASGDPVAAETLRYLSRQRAGEAFTGFVGMVGPPALLSGAKAYLKYRAFQSKIRPLQVRYAKGTVGEAIDIDALDLEAPSTSAKGREPVSFMPTAEELEKGDALTHEWVQERANAANLDESIARFAAQGRKIHGSPQYRALLHSYNEAGEAVESAKGALKQAQQGLEVALSSAKNAGRNGETPGAVFEAEIALEKAQLELEGALKKYDIVRQDFSPLYEAGLQNQRIVGQLRIYEFYRDQLKAGVKSGDIDLVSTDQYNKWWQDRDPKNLATAAPGQVALRVDEPRGKIVRFFGGDASETRGGFFSFAPTEGYDPHSVIEQKVATGTQTGVTNTMEYASSAKAGKGTKMIVSAVGPQDGLTSYRKGAPAPGGALQGHVGPYDKAVGGNVIPSFDSKTGKVTLTPNAPLVYLRRNVRITKTDIPGVADPILNAHENIGKGFDYLRDGDQVGINATYLQAEKMIRLAESKAKQVPAHALNDYKADLASLREELADLAKWYQPKLQ